MDTKFVDLSNGSSKLLTIGAVYRSPNATREHSQLLNKLIDDLQFTKKNIIIIGDWNYPEINWSSKSCCVAETHPASEFLQSYGNTSLTQLIDKPTKEILDQIIFLI